MRMKNAVLLFLLRYIILVSIVSIESKAGDIGNREAYRRKAIQYFLNFLSVLAPWRSIMADFDLSVKLD